MNNSVESAQATRAHARPDDVPSRNPLLDSEGHICAFFHSADEEYRVLLPFIKDGFDLGERACHIVSREKHEDHVRRLIEAGIDVAGAESRGQFVLLDWSQTYLEGGSFDQDRTMSQLAQSRDAGRSQGFSRTRYVAHMEWALEKGDLHELAVYEATSNFASLNGDVAICVYEIPRWDGQVLVNALRSHQLVILGGLLHENPFFQSPAEVLVELNAGRM